MGFTMDHMLALILVVAAVVVVAAVAGITFRQRHGGDDGMRRDGFVNNLRRLIRHERPSVARRADSERWRPCPERYAEPRADTSNSYTNPVLSNVADPDVLYRDGMYYLYPTTTNEEAGGIKVYESRDLVHWRDRGLAMEAGKDNWGSSGFWAPDITERDGRFYLTYTANEHLCVSVSDCPLGPFKQLRFGPMHPDVKEIDAHVFKDKDGRYYLYFVRFDKGNVIYGARLNDDMQSIDESTLTKLLVPSQPWEKDMAAINEAPYVLEHDGTYYLTYSGSHFESPMYGVGYAVSDRPLGPFVKYRFNPIMRSTALVHGPGHHTFAPSPDGREFFILYHVHHDLHAANPRQMAIDRVRFAEGADGDPTLEVCGPTVTPQPLPSGAVRVRPNI